MVCLLRQQDNSFIRLTTSTLLFNIHMRHFMYGAGPDNVHFKSVQLCERSLKRMKKPYCHEMYVRIRLLKTQNGRTIQLCSASSAMPLNL